jgi:hypothetical protein
MFCYVFPCAAMWRCVKMCWYVRLCAACDYVFVYVNMSYYEMILYLRPCVTMCCFVSLSVTMYKDVLLCVMCCCMWSAICKDLLLCHAMCRDVLLCEDALLCATMCLYVRLCLTVSWNLRPCVTMRCFVWLSVTMYEDVLLCVLWCYVWSGICNGMLLCSAMCSHVLLCEDVWRCVAMCDYVILWGDIWNHVLLCAALWDYL